MPKRRITVKELQEWLVDQYALCKVEGHTDIKVRKS